MSPPASNERMSGAAAPLQSLDTYWAPTFALCSGCAGSEACRVVLIRPPGPRAISTQVTWQPGLARLSMATASAPVRPAPTTSTRCTEAEPGTSAAGSNGCGNFADASDASAAGEAEFVTDRSDAPPPRSPPSARAESIDLSN
eukprot:7110523-Prymnesium_polylepis.1